MLLMLLLMLLLGSARLSILELALVPVLHIRLLLIRVLGVHFIRLVCGVAVDVLRHRADLPLLHDSSIPSKGCRESREG